jgi:hypothetical protein
MQLTINKILLLLAACAASSMASAAAPPNHQHQHQHQHRYRHHLMGVDGAAANSNNLNVTGVSYHVAFSA